MRYFIGIDSSTTATKALLMAEDGSVVGVASSSYDYDTPKPLWSEQQPELWWTGTVASIRQLLAETAVPPQSIHAIGLTGQMHGLVLLDQHGAGAAPGAAVERSAHRGRVRRDARRHRPTALN
jgi:xylulokinase